MTLSADTSPNVGITESHRAAIDHASKCDAQIFDPFGSGRLIHDVNKCRRLELPSNITPAITGIL